MSRTVTILSVVTATAALEALNAQTEVNHADVKFAEAELKLAKDYDKLEQLRLGRASAEAVAAIAAGDTISFGYGRAATREVLTGQVVARETNDKGVTQFNVFINAGIKSRAVTIDSTAVLLTDEAVTAERERIEQAKQEAANKAPAEQPAE